MPLGFREGQTAKNLKRIANLESRMEADRSKFLFFPDSPLRNVFLFVGVALLGGYIGRFVASGSLFEHPVILAGILVVGLPLCLYFGRGVSFEKAVVVMVLTLPLLYGFAINIGGTVRITYLFTLLALALGLQQGKLQKLPKDPTTWLLLGFLGYALLSTVFTFWVDFSAPIQMEGFRLTPFRSLVSAGQLVLMGLAFLVTFNYLNSPERLRRFFNLVFWSTALITLYGIYDFAAALFKLPFFSVIYDTSYYAGGVDNPSFTVGGISLPRPRSTLGEPLDLSIFLLFGIPFSLAALSTDKRGLGNWWKKGVVGLEILLFFVANARSSLIALLVVLPLSVLIGGGAYRRQLLLWGSGAYLAIALVLLPLAGGDFNLLSPFTFYQERLQSVTYLAAALEGDRGAGGQIGRGYVQQIKVFKENPILGVGMGNYPFYYSTGSREFVLATTFSMYLRLLTELGLLGTGLFLLFVGRILWLLYKVINRMPNLSLAPFARAALLSTVGVMIARAGLDGLNTDSYMWVMLGTGLAIAQLSRRLQAPVRLSSVA